MKEAYLRPHLSKLLTPKEAAEVLGISIGTLEVWRSTKRYDLKFIKVGRRVMYRHQDIQAFIDQRVVFHIE